VDYLFRKIEKGVFKFPNHFSSGAKDLIRRILQVKPSKRISISAIKKHPWFCVGFKDEIQKPINIRVTSHDLQNAIFDSFYSRNEIEEDEPPSEHAFETLNAFEITSKLIKKDIEKLATINVGAGPVIRRCTQFFAKGTLEVIIDKLMEVMKAENFNPVFKKGRMEIRGYQGNVTMGIKISKTVNENMIFVECYRRQGTILDFQKMYRVIAKKMIDYMFTELPKTPKSMEKFQLSPSSDVHLKACNPLDDEFLISDRSMYKEQDEGSSFCDEKTPIVVVQERLRKSLIAKIFDTLRCVTK
jgi:serine/threonine protein kinase